MKQEEIISLVCSSRHNIKAIKLCNGDTQIIVSKKLISCAMCKSEIRNENGIRKQDRRIVGLIVDKKYCKECAKEIDDILSNVRASHKQPIGKSF